MFASLSSGLLARKGEARPAMRRQATLSEVAPAGSDAGTPAEAGAETETGDDLGWNDMGEPLSPAPAVPAVLPAVLTEREALAEGIQAAALAAIRREPGRRGKIAFTLRLDTERHLRLRLASATRRVSAQQLVTQALDAFLQTMPEVEALARQVPAGDPDRMGE